MTGVMLGWKNGSRRMPLTTATRNEYTAIRPNTAAHLSPGSARSRRRIVGTLRMTSPSCRSASIRGLNGRR